MKLSGIKLIIWDFDNTLYRSVPELSDAVREAEIRVIMQHTSWVRDEALKEFNALYHRIYFSATQTAAHLAGIPFTRAAAEMEEFFDRRMYLSRDELLIAMFGSLSSYRHIILTNGVVQKVKESLQVLGVSPMMFELILSSEIIGAHKPDPQVFAYILEKTGLPVGSVLMVGDRDAVDIAPAKATGIHTCFVWGNSEIAEFSLPKVYDVPSILG